MKNDKILQLAGLATKAGKTVSGEFSTEKAVKDRKAKLVIIASDASANTTKLFENKCAYYAIPYMIYGDKFALGKVTGHDMRASLAITDKGFASSLIEKAKAGNIVVNQSSDRLRNGGIE